MEAKKDWGKLPHNFNEPLGFVIYSIAKGYVDGGVHYSQYVAQALIDKDYSRTTHAIHELVAKHRLDAAQATIATQAARIAALEGHIREAAKKEYANFVARDTVARKARALRLHKWHLAALNHTEQPLEKVEKHEG